jgi:hypothetical protein
MTLCPCSAQLRFLLKERLQAQFKNCSVPAGGTRQEQLWWLAGAGAGRDLMLPSSQHGGFSALHASFRSPFSLILGWLPPTLGDNKPEALDGQR